MLYNFVPKFVSFYRHDVAEDAGMSAFSFGEEGVDRYMIVYKKEYLPSDDELTTLRNGEEWSEEKGKEIVRKVSTELIFILF